MSDFKAFFSFSPAPPVWMMVLFLLFLTPLVHAQIPVSGDLVLGDTSQVHILNTKSGDQLAGRVLAFDRDSLVFLYNGNEIGFQLNNITLVEVRTKTVASDSQVVKILVPALPKHKTRDFFSPFEYEVTMKDGQVHIGTLLWWDADTLRLGQAATPSFPTTQVRQIRRLGKPVTEIEYRPGRYHQMTTSTDNSFVGQLESIDGKEVVFLMRNGSQVRFPKNQVASVRLVELSGRDDDKRSVRGGNYPNQQRHFFSPSALLPEKGQSEFRTLLLFNTVDHGISDHITIGGGFYTFVVATALSAKVKVGTDMGEKFHIAVGAQGSVFLPGFPESGVSVGLLYGAVTLGTKDRFVTFATGIGKDNQTPYGTLAHSLGLSYRTTENWRFFLEYLYFNPRQTDTYYQSDKFLLGTAGMSWIKIKHQIDFGLSFGTFFDTEPMGIPVVSYSFRF